MPMNTDAAAVERPALDAHATISLLNNIIAEAGGGDYVYEAPNGSQCVNVWQGRPSCLAGRVLAASGAMTMEELTLDTNASVTVLVGHWPYRLTRGAIVILTEVQELQDSMVPWGIALERALELWRSHGAPV
jgi:hypothetical protein